MGETMKKNGNGKHHPIGVLLKYARERRKLTADEAAAACRVHRSAYYKWEAGCYIFPKRFTVISQALHIPITKLRDANGRRPKVRAARVRPTPSTLSV